MPRRTSTGVPSDHLPKGNGHVFHDPALAEAARIARKYDLKMMGGVVTAQEAGRPQPQTTGEGNGGPFIRHSQAGRVPIYNRTGDAFGGIITQALTARPGYFRNFRVTRTFVTTGAVTGGITLTADAPYSSDALVQMKDAFGTPLAVGGGYEIEYLLSVFGGHFGLDAGSNFPANLPSWTAVSATTGAGSYSYALPLEFAKAIGCLSGANASLLPTLQFNLAALSAFSSTGTVNLPTITTQIDADIYWLPEGVSTEPPGLGTTRQWQVVQANPTVAASSSARVQFPRLGGYLTDLIIIARDSTAARTDGYWPSRLQVYVDGVAYVDSTLNEVYDDMAIAYGMAGGLATSARPTGVLAFSRRTSLNQKSMGLLDTGESYLSTNPATLIELNGSPWSAGANSPATMNILVGQVIPVGAVIQGLPEV